LRKEGTLADVPSCKAGHCGTKRQEIDLEVIKVLPLNQCNNLRSIASHIGVNVGTLYNRIKEGQIIPHSNVVKPFLMEVNKMEHLCWCLAQLNSSRPNDNPVFQEMFDTVHLDEKWFYMTKTLGCYYLVKSKRFITKVMFLIAVARPRQDYGRNQKFDGKLGIWAFVH
jgi:hypothetical protein